MKFLPAHAVVIVALAGIAHGAEQPLLGLAQQAKATFDRLDADGDDAISRSEAQANGELAAQFGMLDINENGQLDEAEFARFEPREDEP